MADKMMRMAGRGVDTTAKPISVSNSGKLHTMDAVEELINKLVSDTDIPVGTTKSFGDFRVDGLDELYINTATGSFFGYKIIVEEILLGSGTPKILKTHTSAVFSSASEFTVKNITSHYVRISVQNISTSGIVKIGLFAVAKKTKKVDIKDSIDDLKSTLNTLTNTLNSNLIKLQQPKKLPKLPIISNVNIKKTSVNYVQDFQNGLFYGTYGVNIFTSPDGGTWTPVASIPSSETTNRIIEHLFKTDTGRLVVCCYGGDVFISSESGVFGSTPSFSSGTFNHNWGTTRHANVIGFTTYEVAGLDAGQKHEAWLSVDNGATFQKIFDNSVITDAKFPPLTDTRTHLHDIEYDPYTGRIWIWAGDFDAQSLYYSDTMGASWELFGNARKIAGNATQLVSNQYGLALGADTYGGGLGFINIDRSKQLNPIPVLSDLDDNYWRKQDTTKRYLSTKKWVDRKNNVFLIPAAPEYDEDGRRGYLAFSENGKDWTVIWESPHSNHVAGLNTIVYGDGKLVGAYHDGGTSGYTTFTADLKIFDK